MDQSHDCTRSVTTESHSSKGSPRDAAVEELLTIDRHRTQQEVKATKSKKATGFWGRRTEIEIPEYWTGPGA